MHLSLFDGSLCDVLQVEGYGSQVLRPRQVASPLDEQALSRSEQYYLGLPEEFYSHSQLPVIAPTLPEEWIATRSAPGSALDFQEVIPGSGRLTLRAYRWGLAVGFPIGPL